MQVFQQLKPGQVCVAPAYTSMACLSLQNQNHNAFHLYYIDNTFGPNPTN